MVFEIFVLNDGWWWSFCFRGKVVLGNIGLGDGSLFVIIK